MENVRENTYYESFITHILCSHFNWIVNRITNIQKLLIESRRHFVSLRFILFRFIDFRFILDQIAGAADSAEMPRRPSPQTPPPAPPGGAQGVPRPAERRSPSSVSWVVPWASSRWDVPGTPPEEGVQEPSCINAQ
ncbi:hypothetical protein GOODEAATRI_029470, partial [Goodea atripinnis]